MSRGNYLFIKLIEDAFENMITRKETLVMVDTFKVPSITSPAGGVLQTHGHVRIDFKREQKKVHVLPLKWCTTIEVMYKCNTFISLPYTTQQEKMEAIAYLRNIHCLPSAEKITSAKSLLYTNAMRDLMVSKNINTYFKYSKK